MCQEDVIDFLKLKPKRFYDAAEIAEKIPRSRSNVDKALAHLRDFKELYYKRQMKNMPRANKKVWVYRYRHVKGDMNLF